MSIYLRKTTLQKIFDDEAVVIEQRQQLSYNRSAGEKVSGMRMQNGSTMTHFAELSVTGGVKRSTIL